MYCVNMRLTSSEPRSDLSDVSGRAGQTWTGNKLHNDKYKL